MNKISHETRKDIIDTMRSNRIHWWGGLEETQFLSRLYDLKKLPSHDSRYKTAFEDIKQHRDNYCDWGDDWIYDDPRFNLLNCSEGKFLKFLCETIHPAVRPNLENAKKLCHFYNSYLVNDGYKIKPEENSYGVIKYKPLELGSHKHLETITKNTFGEVNDEYVMRQIDLMNESVNSNSSVAIGKAKEFIETICKTILNQNHVEYSNSAKISKLVNLTVNALILVPKGIEGEAAAIETIKKITRTLGSLTQGISELRNIHGDGHGKPIGYKGLLARHAKFIVGTAQSLAVFLYETHKAQEPELPDSCKDTPITNDF